MSEPLGAMWVDDVLVPAVLFQPAPPPRPEIRGPRYVSPDQAETWELVNERLNDGC